MPKKKRKIISSKLKILDNYHQKFVCPYCAKTYAQKSYIGAKKHLLDCAKRNKGQGKLSQFFNAK